MGADRSALAALGAAAALLVVLVASTSGGLQAVSLPHSSAPGSTTSQHQPSGSAPSTGGQPPTSTSGSTHGLDWLPTGSRLVLIMVFAMIVLALFAILRFTFVRRPRLSPGRTRSAQAAIEDPPLEEQESLQDVLESEVAGLEEGAPRNAIVAAWIRLEDFGERHGVPRDPADTPAEFVERALATYDLDGAALRRLADLYREARFSTHPLGEHQRAEARACLEHLVAGAAS